MLTGLFPKRLVYTVYALKCTFASGAVWYYSFGEGA